MAYFKILRPGIRRSQVINTFGPGSIVDLQHTSAMMAGLDFWPATGPGANGKPRVVVIREPALEKLLSVDEFRMPAVGRGDDVPALIFPEWYVCPHCHRLAPYSFYTMGGTHRPGSVVNCPRCTGRKKAYPARFIVACRHGHIDNFPWAEWVHHRSNKEICKRPQLYLRPMGISSTLNDLLLECKACEARTTMAGATQEEQLGFHSCSGRRPWLNDKVPCQEPVVPLQRGASNVYFGLHASSISIPPWSRSIFSELDTHWNTLRSIPDDSLLQQLIASMDLPGKLGRSLDELFQAVLQRRAHERGDAVSVSENELRYNECLALQHGTGEAELDDEFTAKPAEVAPVLQPYFRRVVLVERLREVRALLGFTRITPADPSNREATTMAPLSRSRKNWLPAIEVRGEGVYLEFDETRLARWSALQGVQQRAARLNRAYQEMCERRGWEPVQTISPRFLLTHSLAHALIRELSIESGYASASLRERLYVFEPDTEENRPGIAGLLIYTATPDSEGSLGGLVRQGQPDRLAATLLSAIQEASWCSSDPLCIESEGQGPDTTNLAACHACMLTSETSCEQFNRYLDRAMLVGTLDEPAVGYFSPLLEG